MILEISFSIHISTLLHIHSLTYYFEYKLFKQNSSRKWMESSSILSFCPCKTISFPICQYICIYAVYTISCFNPQTLMGFLSSLLLRKYKLISILIYIFFNQKHHSLFPYSAFLENTTSMRTDRTQKETQTAQI